MENHFIYQIGIYFNINKKTSFIKTLKDLYTHLDLFNLLHCKVARVTVSDSVTDCFVACWDQFYVTSLNWSRILNGLSKQNCKRSTKSNLKYWHPFICIFTFSSHKFFLKKVSPIHPCPDTEHIRYIISFNTHHSARCKNQPLLGSHSDPRLYCLYHPSMMD